MHYFTILSLLSYVFEKILLNIYNKNRLLIGCVSFNRFRHKKYNIAAVADLTGKMFILIAQQNLQIRILNLISKQKVGTFILNAFM